MNRVRYWWEVSCDYGHEHLRKCEFHLPWNIYRGFWYIFEIRLDWVGLAGWGCCFDSISFKLWVNIYVFKSAFLMIRNFEIVRLKFLFTSETRTCSMEWNMESNFLLQAKNPSTEHLITNPTYHPSLTSKSYQQCFSINKYQRHNP